jgi:hypothetical protein
MDHPETDGVEHDMNVIEKRNRKRWKIVPDAAQPVFAYKAQGGIKVDRESRLFRPLRPDGLGPTKQRLWQRDLLARGPHSRG